MLAGVTNADAWGMVALIVAMFVDSRISLTVSCGVMMVTGLGGGGMLSLVGVL